MGMFLTFSFKDGTFVTRQIIETEKIKLRKQVILLFTLNSKLLQFVPSKKYHKNLVDSFDFSGQFLLQTT